MTLILLLLELGLLAAACFILCMRWGNTHAESGAYALLLPLMALGFGFEVAFLLDTPLIVWVWELILSFATITILVHTRKDFGAVWRPMHHAIKTHPVAVIALIFANILFLIQIFPASPDRLGYIIQSSLYDPLITQQRMAMPGALPLLPGNIEALSLWLIRFHGAAAQSLPALMAFGTITFATYALARRYAWPPTAITVTLMVISMPRLVCLASAGSSEIVHVAVCLLGLLIVYRLVERPCGRDLFILLMTIGFGISIFQLRWLYPVMIIPLALIIIVRRHGTLFFKTIATRQSLLPTLTLIPTALFNIYPLLARLTLKAGTADNAWALALNSDGIQGAMANGIRYLMEAIHFTLPVDQLCRFLAQSGLVDMLQRFYTALLFPVLGNLGAIAPFQIHWAPNADQAWFGPFGFLVILPALLYALIRGPRRLKAVAVSLVSYFYLITLIPAWQPGNAVFFTVLFTVGGFTTAFSLPPWRFSIRTKHFLQTISFALLYYSLLFNPFGLLAHQLP